MMNSPDSFDNRSAIELIPSEDAKSRKKPSPFSRLQNLICFNKTVLIEHDSFPTSLQFLVYYFRILTASFSGCLFVEKPEPINPKQARHQIDDKAFSLAEWKYTQIAMRLLLIIVNCLTIAYFAIPLVVAVLDARRDTGNGTDLEEERLKDIKVESIVGWLNQGTNSTINSFERGIDFALIAKIIFDVARGHQHGSDTESLKPILRMIMTWLVYVYMLNGLASSLFNLFFGGSFIRHLLSIREFSVVDRRQSLAAVLIGADLVVVIAIKLGVIWAYQQEQIQLIISGGTADEDKFAKFERKLLTINFVIELGFSFVQTLFLTMNTLLFVYSMVMFRWCIENLQNDVKRATDLDELQLSLIKTRLFRLNEAFKTTVRYFSVPITLDLLACTYMLIGSSCFLIINQNRDNMSPFAVSFIAKIGLLALIRLVVVASAGNFATNASSTLIRLIYEGKVDWTLQEWLMYLEIKRAPAEFVVSMFAVYTVQQSSILVILGFALNYIVILLQTENYSGTAANGTAANESTAADSLKNITDS